jgi:YcaO-like protein with predicted kinase domain
VIAVRGRLLGVDIFSAPALVDALEQPLRKNFRQGTHRIAAPAQTLARVRPHMQRMGITRLGNITGLDRIGIPVAVAVRPNSRSVSVSQGKGLELPQAMASALMEACEGFHAEEIGPCRVTSYRDLTAAETVVDPTSLSPGVMPFDADAPISWIAGFDLSRQEICWVPAEIVHTNYTVHQPVGYFLCGSNGLASGNHLIEAINAGLYELVERDALALWIAKPLQARMRSILDLGTVDEPNCRALLAKYEAARIAVRIWNVTTDIGIAAFLCEIRDSAAGDPQRLRRSQGSGCHADRAVALSRALTEAAQARLTYIAGIRDDLSPAEYKEPPGSEISDALLDALAREVAPISFSDVPSFTADDLTEDLRWALARLQGIGLERVIAVDLTRPDFEIPVVRVIIPGLEWDPQHPNYRSGLRAQGITRQ